MGIQAAGNIFNGGNNNIFGATTKPVQKQAPQNSTFDNYAKGPLNYFSDKGADDSKKSGKSLFLESYYA